MKASLIYVPKLQFILHLNQVFFKFSRIFLNDVIPRPMSVATNPCRRNGNKHWLKIKPRRRQNSYLFGEKKKAAQKGQPRQE